MLLYKLWRTVYGFTKESRIASVFTQNLTFALIIYLYGGINIPFEIRSILLHVHSSFIRVFPLKALLPKSGESHNIYNRWEGPLVSKILGTSEKIVVWLLVVMSDLAQRVDVSHIFLSGETGKQLQNLFL